MHMQNAWLFGKAEFNIVLPDSFLVNLLKHSGSVNYKENNTLLPTLYSLLTLDFMLPRTLVWSFSKTFLEI